MKWVTYVVEESRENFKHPRLCKSQMELGTVLFFQNKKDAEEWCDVLETARGIKSGDLTTAPSSFRVVKLKEVE